MSFDGVLSFARKIAKDLSSIDELHDEVTALGVVTSRAVSEFSRIQQNLYTYMNDPSRPTGTPSVVVPSSNPASYLSSVRQMASSLIGFAKQSNASLAADSAKMSQAFPGRPMTLDAAVREAGSDGDPAVMAASDRLSDRLDVNVVLGSSTRPVPAGIRFHMDTLSAYDRFWAQQMAPKRDFNSDDDILQGKEIPIASNLLMHAITHGGGTCTGGSGFVTSQADIATMLSLWTVQVDPTTTSSSRIVVRGDYDYNRLVATVSADCRLQVKLHFEIPATNQAWAVCNASPTVVEYSSSTWALPDIGEVQQITLHGALPRDVQVVASGVVAYYVVDCRTGDDLDLVQSNAQGGSDKLYCGNLEVYSAVASTGGLLYKDGSPVGASDTFLTAVGNLPASSCPAVLSLEQLSVGARQLIGWNAYTRSATQNGYGRLDIAIQALVDETEANYPGSTANWAFADRTFSHCSPQWIFDLSSTDLLSDAARQYFYQRFFSIVQAHIACAMTDINYASHYADQYALPPM